MPNRVIKDSIKSSDEIDSLTWFQEVMFYSLMVTVDDYGCYDAKPKLIKNTLFPLKDDLTLSAVSEGLDALERAGLIQRYECDGKQYLYLTTWANHQRIRNKTKRYPEPPGGYPQKHDPQTFDSDSRRIAADCGELQHEKIACGESRPNPIQSNPIQEEDDSAHAREKSSAASEDELLKIQHDHSELFDMMDRIGLKASKYNVDRIIEIYSDFGKDRTLHAMSEAARCNKISLAYIGAVAKDADKHRKSADADDWEDIPLFT